MSPDHGLFDIPFAVVKCYRGQPENSQAFLWLEVHYGKHVLTPSAAGAPLQVQADELYTRLRHAIDNAKKRRKDG